MLIAAAALMQLERRTGERKKYRSTLEKNGISGYFMQCAYDLYK